MQVSRPMLDREEIVTEYLMAWNTNDVPRLMRLLHPQASWYDAFWAETCSGPDLSAYIQDMFDIEKYWYRPDEELIHTPNGVVMRYAAFYQTDTAGAEPVFKGAEILSLSDGLIMTISDFYCDPSRDDLVEIASFVERQHAHANVAPLGLSARTSGRIKRRLSELKTEMTVFLDPSLTVAQLSNHVGCSVMHLFHVLEEEMEISFLQFALECRARYASTLLTDKANRDVGLDQIAHQAGFETTSELRNAFRITFGMSAKDYVKKFAK